MELLRVQLNLYYNNYPVTFKGFIESLVNGGGKHITLTLVLIIEYSYKN